MSTFAIIIPACDEEQCIAAVLAELVDLTQDMEVHIVVGVNGTRDRTAEIARGVRGVHVVETASGGYGHGCAAAATFAARLQPAPEAYIYFAADGANDPRDIRKLIAAYEAGCPFVLGSRTRTRANLPALSLRHAAANRLLGAWCGLLTGHFYSDLGPLRLIDARLYEDLALREWTYGWTIEAQIRGAMLGARISEVDVGERPRLAGRQKVSRVSWRQTLRVGLHILAAGWRTRLRSSVWPAPASPTQLLPISRHP